MVFRINLTRSGILVFGLYLLTTSSIVLAQSPATTTESVAAVEVAEVIAPPPYRLEALPGNRVFNDFVLGPGRVELEIAPGESKTVELNVSNRYPISKRFTVNIEDITGSRNAERAAVLLGDEEGPYTLKDYISIPNPTFDLEPNLRAIVPVTISIPPDAEPGGRYGSVLVQTVTREANPADQVSPIPSSAVVSRIGTLFFIRIAGDVEASGQLEDFTTINNKSWYETGPVDFQIVYENTGSVHLNPYGEVRINNMFGEEVGYVELEPWYALPQSLRFREISWDREYLYGRYTATLTLNRGYDDVLDEATVTFWIIPWKLILPALGGVFIILFLIRAFFRKFEFKVKES